MRRKILCVLLVILAVMLGGCGDDEDAFDFSGIEPKTIDPWVYIEDTSISMNAALSNLASSSAELGITIGVMGIVFSVFYMAIRVFFSKSASAKEEIKRGAVLKGMIAIMLFSIPFWMGLFKYFAELLV